MKRILVIDDDPFIRSLAEHLLTNEDRIVNLAAGGGEGLTHLTQPAPDLVLLDLQLPDIPGFEVLKVLRQAKGWEQTKILMLTASSEIENLVEAKAGGAAGYICKPFQTDALLAMVRDVLEQPDLIWMDDYTRARAH
jgi:DNA-binding response OmpR family regulator